MPRLFKGRSAKSGLPPGTLTYVGEKKNEKVKTSVLDYTEQNVIEKNIETIEDSFSFRDKDSVTWVNINGLHNLDIIRKAGEHFQIHPLILEDIVNTGQRPKVEVSQEQTFIVMKMLSFDEKKLKIDSEQVSIVLGKNWLLSFQEKEGDVFNLIRERIRSAKGRIRKGDAAYLGYSLIDAIVDHYFFILERLGESIESMEMDIEKGPDNEVLARIHHLRKELIVLRKSVWPLRELVNSLLREESDLISKTTRMYFKDVYDHTIQIIDTVESYRDIVSGLTDLYMSCVSNKMNEVMKVLTIMASLFIPLTFIAGIYGMNFEYMPELKWHYGYHTVWIVMTCTVISMLVYFKKKQWI